MRWLAFEHSPGAYRADFYLYGAVDLALGAALLLAAPASLGLAGWAAAGVLGWSLLEYLLHRFVLHGMPLFRRWHAEHHRRPGALIAAPTALSAALFATLLLPAIWWLGVWPAAALSFGMLGGYIAYGLTHHAIHQPTAARPSRIGGRWLRRRRQWHGLHHRPARLTPDSPPPMSRVGYYGVSSTFWDRVFGTDRPRAQDVTSSACHSPPRSRP